MSNLLLHLQDFERSDLSSLRKDGEARQRRLAAESHKKKRRKKRKAIRDARKAARK